MVSTSCKVAIPEWLVFGGAPSLEARHCILKESINHTYNITVKTHETAIFVTAYLVAKGFKLFTKRFQNGNG